jgi:hypothetical protein
VFDADPLEIKAGKLATLELFAEALAIYSEGKFAEAAWLFSEADVEGFSYLEEKENAIGGNGLSD